MVFGIVWQESIRWVSKEYYASLKELIRENPMMMAQAPALVCEKCGLVFEAGSVPKISCIDVPNAAIAKQKKQERKLAAANNKRQKCTNKTETYLIETALVVNKL